LRLATATCASWIGYQQTFAGEEEDAPVEWLDGLERAWAESALPLLVQPAFRERCSILLSSAKHLREIPVLLCDTEAAIISKTFLSRSSRVTI
jgi:hypothetical protein